MFFISGNVSIDDAQMNEAPKVNDSKDFVAGGKEFSRLWSLFYYIVFSGAAVFYIAYLVILATTFHGTGMTDLISAFYLFFSFFYILYFRRFYTKNSMMLSALRKYNVFVLLSILMF